MVLKNLDFWMLIITVLLLFLAILGVLIALVDLVLTHNLLMLTIWALGGLIPLTNANPTTARVYEGFRTFRESEGKNPTIRELAERIGVSHTTVRRHINHLVALGYMKKEIKRRRGSCLVDPSDVE